jgi:hypothetical protein
MKPCSDKIRHLNLRRPPGYPLSGQCLESDLQHYCLRTDYHIAAKAFKSPISAPFLLLLLLHNIHHERSS